jgi:hypothetical protein
VKFNVEAALRRYDLMKQIGERMHDQHKVPQLVDVTTWKGVLTADDFLVGDQVEGCSGRLWEVVQGKSRKLWELRGKAEKK